jgi:hypothetical protein
MANSSTVNGGTVLTIPANSIWQGCVIMSGALVNAPGGSASTVTATVAISGTGGNWNNGDIAAALTLAVPAVNLTALIGASALQTLSTAQITIQSRANPVLLVLTLPTGMSGIAVASGSLQ